MKNTILSRLKNVFLPTKEFKTFVKLNKRMTITELDRLIESQENLQTHSGIVVGEDMALHQAAFFSGVMQISQTIASLPLILYTRDNNNRREYIEHPLYRVLRYSANDETNAFNFIETMVVYMLLWGNAYAYKIRDNGNRIIGFVQLHPSKVEIKINDNGNVEYHVRVKNETKIFTKYDILHITFFSLDGINGLSVLRLAREGLGLMLGQEGFNARFIGHGTNLGGVITPPPDMVMSKDAKDNLKKSIKDLYSGFENSHGVMVLDPGMTYQPLGMQLEDAQFLQSRVFQIQEVARWLNMPPHKLKDHSKSSFDNIQQEQLSFLNDTIRPWLVRIEAAINSQTLNRKQQGFVFCEFNTKEYVRGDLESLNKALSIERLNGIITANEWRAMTNRNPIDGDDGDIRYMPANMMATNKKQEVPDATESNEGAEIQPDEGTADL